VERLNNFKLNNESMLYLKKKKKDGSKSNDIITMKSLKACSYGNVLKPSEIIHR